MNPLILTLSHFFHLLATVIWIGGIILILLVILPSAKVALESAPVVGRLMQEITKRFTPMANISILVLIVTGVVFISHEKNFTGFLDFMNPWNLVMLLKSLLVAVMIIIHFYRGLILNPKIERLSGQVENPQVVRLRKYSSNLVKTNLALGVAVLLVSGILLSI